MMRQLFAWQAVVTSLQRLQSTRYDCLIEGRGTRSYFNKGTRGPGGADDALSINYKLSFNRAEVAHIT